MAFFLRVRIFFLLLSPKVVLSCLDDQCRELEFPGAYFFYGERLINHVIRTIKALDQDSCEFQCYLEHNCVSINFQFTGTQICDLNNSTHKEHEKDLEKKEGYVYHGTNNVCGKAPCNNNATCQTGFTRKGYRCLCASGFTGQNCEHDIDECKANTHRCDVNAECNNTKGSYNCTCKPGYSGDGHSCTDIDECAQDIHNCSNGGGSCNNTEGSFHCTCKSGFTGDGHNCRDIDECVENIHNCNSATALCSNTNGTYICICKPGYTGDGNNCTDIDECAQDTHNCSKDSALCNNTEGYFNCTCKPGFIGDGHNCADIDECAQDTHNCSKVGGLCHNTEGSFNCTCKPGFTVDGHNCTDIDECAQDTHNCSKIGALCNNTEGSFNCTCKPGFTGDGHNCTDINECAENIHSCNNATTLCSNTNGSYICICKPGYTGDGNNCTDIDECAQDTHNCSKVGGFCNNTEGSFYCTCKPGFTGDGHNCAAFDICAVQNPCQNEGECENSGDSYFCRCEVGFAGKHCESSFGINSTILLKNESFLPHLHRFLSTAVGNDSQWLLCYRASLHGWDASTFHSRCDGKKNTVTIIEKDSYVFGGYTDIPWADCPPGARTIDPQGRCCVFPFEYRKKTYHTCTTAGFAYYKLWCSFDAVYNNNWADCDSTPYLEYRSSTKAFIYSLSNKEGLEPFQAMVKDAPHAIYTDPSLGPTFGVGKDIYIASNANANYGSYTNFGWSYDVPDGVKDQQTILAGTYHFLLDEVEVFYLI
ncbi:uncharacterized protein LOC144665218 [Oculina patagonica]